MNKSRKNSKRAILLADSACKQYPDNAVVYRTRGCIWLAVDENELAQKDFDHAIKLAPRDAELYYQYSRTFKNQVQLGDALKYIDKAIELDGNNYKYLDTRGQIYKAMHDTRVVSDYTKAIKLAPDSEKWLSQRHLALYFEQTKNYKQALQLYRDENATGHNKNNPHKNDVNIARCLVMLGNYREALPYLGPARKEEDQFEVLHLRAKANRALGNIDAANKDESLIKTIERDF